MPQARILATEIIAEAARLSQDLDETFWGTAEHSRLAADLAALTARLTEALATGHDADEEIRR